MHFQWFLIKGLCRTIGPLPPRFTGQYSNSHNPCSYYHTPCSNYHTSSVMSKRTQPAWAPPEAPADQPSLELYNSLTRK